MAVTTGRPRSRAPAIRARAGSSPPSSSITEIHVIRPGDRGGIRREALDLLGAGAGEIADRGALQHQRSAGRARKHVLPFDECARHGLSHRSDPEQPDAHLLHQANLRHHASSVLRIGGCIFYKEGRMGEITSLCQKLGIKEGRRVLVLDPPVGFVRRLDPLPDGVGVTTKIVSLADVIVVFASSRAVLGELFAKAKHVLAPRGSLWVAWPRKSSGFFTIWTSSWSGRWGWPAD